MLRHPLFLPALVFLGAACGNPSEHTSDVLGSDGAPLVTTASRSDHYTSAVVRKADLDGHRNIEVYIGK